jgi:hypothetical protein
MREAGDGAGLLGDARCLAIPGHGNRTDLATGSSEDLVAGTTQTLLAQAQFKRETSSICVSRCYLP